MMSVAGVKHTAGRSLLFNGNATKAEFYVRDHLEQLPAEGVPQLDLAILPADGRNRAVRRHGAAKHRRGLPLDKPAALDGQHIWQSRLRGGLMLLVLRFALAARLPHQIELLKALSPQNQQRKSDIDVYRVQSGLAHVHLASAVRSERCRLEGMHTNVQSANCSWSAAQLCGARKWFCNATTAG